MIKTIRSKKLTSKEVATVLGVSEASIKRWADSGLLPMERTAGGHRRFRPQDVATVQREGLDGKKSTGPGRQGKPTKSLSPPPEKALKLAPRKVAALVEDVFASLVEGREEDLSAMLVNLHLNGHAVGAILDQFLCVAMNRVGKFWHDGDLSVAEEHVATSTATAAVRKLRTLVDTSGESGVFALCCSVEEDFHELPVQFAALTLEASGIEAFNLGMNTPFFALRETVERFRPDLICVSATVLSSLDRAAREYSDLQKAARRAKAGIVLGGAGFADLRVRKRLPADLHADDFRSLEEFAKALVGKRR